MLQRRFCKYCVLIIALSFAHRTPAEEAIADKAQFPFPEKLTYRIEWRLITAGSAVLNMTKAGASQWQTDLKVQSAGLMTRLYKVFDVYKVVYDSRFCLVTTNYDAEEGKRHTQTEIELEPSKHKMRYEQRDLVKNTTLSSELEVQGCVHEITGALKTLRTLAIDPGKPASIPVTNGRKVTNARVELQARESIVLDGKTYQTVRYEAYIFDNVLYNRKGRLFIWLTDDSERIPVQLRLQMGFPIGNVSILLEKEEKL